MTRTFAHHATRALAISAAIAAAPMSAHAALTLSIPTNALQANGILAFSQDGQDGMEAIGISLKPLGNTTAVPNAKASFVLPVTSISLQLVKIAGGATAGSALEFNRVNDETGEARRVTLANFSIDFNAKKILADSKQAGKATASKTPIFDFNEQTSLGLKYRFPLSITGKQILDKLFLTTEGKAVLKDGLQLPEIADVVLDTFDFGTITVDVAVKLRSKPVSARPYVIKP